MKTTLITMMLLFGVATSFAQRKPTATTTPKQLKTKKKVTTVVETNKSTVASTPSMPTPAADAAQNVPKLTTGQIEAIYKMQGTQEKKLSPFFPRLQEIERQLSENLLQDTWDKDPHGLLVEKTDATDEGSLDPEGSTYARRHRCTDGRAASIFARTYEEAQCTV